MPPKKPVTAVSADGVARSALGAPGASTTAAILSPVATVSAPSHGSKRSQRKADKLIEALIVEEEAEYQMEEKIRRGLEPSASAPVEPLSPLPIGGAGISGTHARSSTGEAPSADITLPRAGEVAAPLPPRVLRGLDSCLTDFQLCQILEYMPGGAVARCKEVCMRWRDVASSESLWKGICKRTIQRYHPSISSNATVDGVAVLQLRRAINPEAFPEEEMDMSMEDGDQVSLSLSRQRQLNAINTYRQATEAERIRLSSIRDSTIATFRQSLGLYRSYCRAYRYIPLVRTNGVYTLRHSYIRTGREDMFHKHSGLLLCVYHRTFHFQTDGIVRYAMIPGSYAEALKEMARDRPTRLLTGWYRLEGNKLRAHIYGPKSLVTKWLFEVQSRSHGSNNCLKVLSCLMLDNPADEELGAGPANGGVEEGGEERRGEGREGGGRPMKGVDEEEVWWVPVPAWR
jgi:hypothetical protein